MHRHVRNKMQTVIAQFSYSQCGGNTSKKTKKYKKSPPALSIISQYNQISLVSNLVTLVLIGYYP